MSGGAAHARRSVGLAEVADAVLLRATGADRVSFLHRLLSCDVQAIPVGGSAPGLLLTAKGKVTADFLLVVLADRVELIAEAAARPGLRDGLSRFVISDDVALEDRNGAAGLLTFVGPKAAAAAARVAGAALVVPRTRAGLPAVDLISDSAALPALRVAALAAAEAEGGGTLTSEELEVLRVESGAPALGAEATADTLPQECGFEALVCFTKGCFLGQEPVARLRTRGHTNRGLAGLLLDPGAPIPAHGAAVLDGEKDVGVVTSAALSPSLGRPIALALLRHESSAAGTRLQLRTGTGPVSCSVAGLPFVR